MNPKQHRNRVFRSGKPVIRELKLDNFDDMKWLWAAYLKGSFNLPEAMTQEEFTNRLLDILSQFEIAWMIEDTNSHFSDGQGPIGWVAANYNGWKLAPHFEAFSWATPKNVLKANVAFLHKMQYNKDIGVIVVSTLKDHQKFYKRLEKYLPRLEFSGRIPKGTPKGDNYLFSMRGQKKWAA